MFGKLRQLGNWIGDLMRGGASLEVEKENVRERIIEGSTEETYLKYDYKLRGLVSRLHAIEVKILFGDGERDLVHELWQWVATSKDPLTHAAKPPELTQVNQYLASRILSELDAKQDKDIYGRTFILGAVDPASLTDALSVEEFVERLTLGYPGYQSLVPEFESTAIVGESFRGRTITQADLQALMAPRQTSIGAERDPVSRLDLLRFAAAAFELIGEPVSFWRLKALNPYLPGLARCPVDRRAEILRKMLSDEYPFTRDNQDGWHAQIGSAMS